jgi:hypothetical protein
LGFVKQFPRLIAMESESANADPCRANLAPYPNVRVVEGAIEGEAGLVAPVDTEGKAITEWVGLPRVIIKPRGWSLSGKKTSRPFQRALANLDFSIFIKGEHLVYGNTVQPSRSSATDNGVPARSARRAGFQ